MSDRSSISLAKGNAIPGDMTTEPFWDTYSIDETRWDQQFPYQLMLLKRTGTDRYDQVADGTFTLPIPPQAMTISMPLAIHTSVTLGGIVEEHNGAPLRMITMSGTTGILPGRGAAKALQSFNFAQTIFGGTIQAATRAINSASSAVGTAAPRPNVVTNDELLGDLKNTTGYYQMHLLKQFLEGYAALKKTREGREYRLGLAIWKDQEIFLISPMSFDVVRNAQSPLEYRYTLAMKAFKRIKLTTSEAPFSIHKPVSRDPAAFTQLMQRLDTARRAVSQLRDVVAGVRADVDASLFEPLRESALFVKDTLGVAISVADLPVNIIRDMKGAIIEAVGIQGTVRGAAQSFASIASRSNAELQSIFKAIQQYSIETQTLEKGTGSTGVQGDSGANPVNKLFEQPERYYDLFAALKPGDLNLSPAMTKRIVEERARVRRLRRLDFENFRNNMEKVAADFADSVGLGNATYNATYGRPPPPTGREATQEDMDFLFNLNQSIMEMNRLAASEDVDRGRVSAIEYVAGLAGRSGITFQVPASQFQVPFPYKNTLEMVAARYLGDANRWHEIATLNRLREPYVDEEGFFLPFLTNGSGSQLVVADASNLYVGQAVTLSSTSVIPEKRRITRIQPITPGNTIVFVDGSADLTKFTTEDVATLHTFLPDTVNSQMLISIPSDKAPADVDFGAKTIPGLDLFQAFIDVGGVDLLITDSGDLAITPDGDCRLAIGMTNLVQRLRLFISTPRGSLLHHPGYGFAIQPGSSTADLTAAELLDNMRDIFVWDPAFTGIKSATIQKDGPVLRAAISVGVAGTNQNLPVSFELRR